jgi:hypothetical protein
VRTALGVIAWALCIFSLILVPVSFAWQYTTIWVGITLLMTGYFVVGYATVSQWRGNAEGTHILTFSGLILAVSAYSFIYRLTTGAPEPTPEIIRGWYIGSAVWISLAFLMLWRAGLWSARQIAARKRRRLAAAASNGIR